MKTLVRKSIIKRSLVSTLVKRSLLPTSNKRWQYNFDGIDDYAQLPTIPLFAGDAVEFDFIGIADWSDGPYLLSGTSGSGSGLLVFTDEDGTIGIDGTNDSRLFYVDGILIIGTTPLPTDGQIHTYKMVLTDTRELDTVAVRFDRATRFFSDVIKNLRIIRANPTDQYPNLFWPMDDGWANNPVMRQTIPHAHKTDGTESYDSDGAIWVDYETEAAPQYVGVTGYETLAERAVLSGLSEHDEAVASCREGVVKNGDFRFGADKWIPDAGWQIINGVAYCNSNQDNANRDLKQWNALTAGEKYTISFDVVSYTSGSLYLYIGQANITSNLLLLNSSLSRVEKTFTASDTPINLFAYPFVGAITNIQIRKVTEQQVLTPYVNHGEYVNFNEENWEYV